MSKKKLIIKCMLASIKNSIGMEFVLIPAGV